MKKVQTIREFLSPEMKERLDPERYRRYLEANLHPEGDPEIESRLTARMPGDEPGDHPLYIPPNPWMDRVGWSFSKLKGMMEAGEVPKEDWDTAMAALGIMADGGAFLPPGVRPPEPEPDVPQVMGVYQPPVWRGNAHTTDDCDVYDPGGQFTVAPTFNATVQHSDD